MIVDINAKKLSKIGLEKLLKYCWDKLKKEGLIISLLKLESSDAERNYMKHFNNNTDD